ncbi:FecR family protein [Chitinophaga eiseniae]|uniref:DUF4974 domain-containing protein n=1 Tax=Chitinophaga eiseniae TaxID=634771 RepID=A0A847SS49_9BACT|nr:FecR domain-containing protein [Chitinophaga eiseniae]NLR82435.1 DUF4974 domain-containing protein [Chitinophaga eiseniae]
MQEDHTIQPLIDRYLAGHATPEEEQRVNEWFDQWHTPPREGATDGRPSGDDIFAAVQARVQAYEAENTGRVVAMKPTRVRWRLAASVISVAMMVAGGWWYRSKVPARKPAVKFLDLYTQAGQLSKITLTDSSVIWLNASSHLRYPEQFSTNRTVYLEGEAYFDVRQDPQHPFVIESNGYRTRVLGTTFSIRSYTAPNTYKVTVSSGKVAVYQGIDSSHAVLLTANQELRINIDKGTQQVRNVRAQSLMLWKEGGLCFEKDYLAEVVVSLQHRYGKTFRITAAPLQNMEISGTFDPHQSLEDILKILSKVYGLHFKATPNGIINIS